MYPWTTCIIPYTTPTISNPKTTKLIELKKWNDKTNPENHYEEELSE
jgi:hypothetical protein